MKSRRLAYLFLLQVWDILLQTIHTFQYINMAIKQTIVVISGKYCHIFGVTVDRFGLVTGLIGLLYRA
jgi:hypothetical protein